MRQIYTDWIGPAPRKDDVLLELGPSAKRGKEPDLSPAAQYKARVLMCMSPEIGHHLWRVGGWKRWQIKS